MAKSKKGYLDQGFDKIVNVVLAIIPFTSWLLGGITRLMRGHIIAGILQLIPPFTVVFWIIDIYHVCTEGDLSFFA